ncbi:hypothetical protein DFJ73DRAFT_867837 [Zopfochytrium polystomum]|nr:hypothetical protein DFJ73DRAFT_867837 [Zopfochytrium polystomum]
MMHFTLAALVCSLLVHLAKVRGAAEQTGHPQLDPRCNDTALCDLTEKSGAPSIVQSSTEELALAPIDLTVTADLLTSDTLGNSHDAFFSVEEVTTLKTSSGITPESAATKTTVTPALLSAATVQGIPANAATISHSSWYSVCTPLVRTRSSSSTDSAATTAGMAPPAAVIMSETSTSFVKRTWTTTTTTTTTSTTTTTTTTTTATSHSITAATSPEPTSTSTTTTTVTETRTRPSIPSTSLRSASTPTSGPSVLGVDASTVRRSTTSTTVLPTVSSSGTTSPTVLQPTATVAPPPIRNALTSESCNHASATVHSESPLKGRRDFQEIVYLSGAPPLRTRLFSFLPILFATLYPMVSFAR